MEKRFLVRASPPPRATLRAQLSTLQIVTVLCSSPNGQTLRNCTGTRPEVIHRDIYRTLQIRHEIMRPVKRRVLLRVR